MHFTDCDEPNSIDVSNSSVCSTECVEEVENAMSGYGSNYYTPCYQTGHQYLVSELVSVTLADMLDVVSVLFSQCVSANVCLHVFFAVSHALLVFGVLSLAMCLCVSVCMCLQKIHPGQMTRDFAIMITIFFSFGILGYYGLRFASHRKNNNNSSSSSSSSSRNNSNRTNEIALTTTVTTATTATTAMISLFTTNVNHKRTENNKRFTNTVA